MADDLDRLVRDAAELTGADPPPLMEPDAPVLRMDSPASAGAGGDGFYVIGLIGGKEVGKTALVNALAGQSLSAPTGYGPGTETVIAYVHEQRAAAVAALLAAEAPGRHQIITHRIADLGGQVLLDLPDIDSIYTQHLELTRRMLRHMLYPLWIQSVEKYADHQPLRLLAAVAAGNDPANFVFCLNKIDQVIAAEGPAAAAELRQDYAARLAAALGLPRPPQVHLTSAIRPQEHDLPALREMLGRQKSRPVVQQSLDLASRRRGRTVLDWLGGQSLPALAQRLGRIETEAHDLVASRLATPLLERVVPALLDDPSHRLAVVDQVMSRRVARWPIVNVLHVLLAPLTALWRRNLAPARGPDDAALVGAWVDAAGPLAGHVQAAFAILHQSHPGGAQLYRHRRLWEPMAAEESAEQLRRSLTRALGRQRQRAVERLAGRRGIVAPVIRFVLTIGAALWFPLLQPLAEALATGGIQRQWGEMAADLGLLAVRVFSAAYLLQAAAFLGLWYLTLWLILRWDTQRKVARLLERWRSAEAGETGEADASPPSAVIEWIEGLLEPARQSRQRADELVRRADELRQELASPAA